ncbi:MAG TPA: hypothetical protein VFR38_11635 [Gaiellaceae bacterium]|nr:hypothetical protein [Gaiellaceae bacterium]
MRKLLKWIVVTVGVTALVRWFRRRGAEPEIAAPPTTDDPAEELRRKLAASREAEEPAEAPAASETTVEERRADVHEQGRATLDEMKSPDEG